MTQSTSRNDSAGRLTGDPRKGGGAPLSGRVVLLPRLKERDPIASALERAGARVLRAAVTRTVPGEAAALEATARKILVAAMPTLAGRSRRRRTSARTQRPMRTGLPMRRREPVTSRKASSMLTRSSRGVTSPRTSMTWAETRL